MFVWIVVLLWWSLFFSIWYNDNASLRCCSLASFWIFAFDFLRDINCLAASLFTAAIIAITSEFMPRCSVFARACALQGLGPGQGDPFFPRNFARNEKNWFQLKIDANSLKKILRTTKKLRRSYFDVTSKLLRFAFINFDLSPLSLLLPLPHTPARTTLRPINHHHHHHHQTATTSQHQRSHPSLAIVRAIFHSSISSTIPPKYRHFSDRKVTATM